MTIRLYYTDPLIRMFDATVTACQPSGARFEVRLDRTAFYPTSGGQPFDTGRLGGRDVIDVTENDAAAIQHIVGEPLEVGGRVRGEIDWPRRFDHMQQHTGQHVLSAAFDRLMGARTVSFHLGAESSTIDLAREVTAAEVSRAEAEANRVVWENQPVRVRFVTEEEAASLPLRKEPVRTGPLRLVEVEGFDLSACGGTHVPETGRIGIIAIAGWERFKGATRVAFVCGGRALRSHGALRDVVSGVTRALSVAPADAPPAIERLQAELKEAGRTARKQQEEIATARAAEFRAQAETVGRYRGVLRTFPGWDAVALKTLAAAVASEPGFVVVLAGDGQPLPVVVARSSDVEIDLGAWMKRATSELGGRGGGRPELAQGGIAADAERVLAFARSTLQ
jgi:alanyl-tRNA synthetase